MPAFPCGGAEIFDLDLTTIVQGTQGLCDRIWFDDWSPPAVLLDMVSSELKGWPEIDRYEGERMPPSLNRYTTHSTRADPIALLLRHSTSGEHELMCPHHRSHRVKLDGAEIAQDTGSLSESPVSVESLRCDGDTTCLNGSELAHAPLSEARSTSTRRAISCPRLIRTTPLG